MNEPKKPDLSEKQRRPYAKPEMKSFELFERRSLTCTAQPVNSRNPGCGVIQHSVA